MKLHEMLSGKTLLSLDRLRDRQAGQRADHQQVSHLITRVLESPFWSDRFCSVKNPSWEFRLPNGEEVRLTVKRKPYFDISLKLADDRVISSDGLIDDHRNKVIFKRRVPNQELLARNILVQINKELDLNTAALKRHTRRS